MAISNGSTEVSKGTETPVVPVPEKKAKASDPLDEMFCNVLKKMGQSQVKPIEPVDKKSEASSDIFSRLTKR